MRAVNVLAYLVATGLYAGFQLTVRLVVYPQMDGVPPPAFAAYEAAHQQRVTPLVGVLFAGLAATVLLLLLDGDLPRPAAWAAAGLFGLLLAVTGLGAVPQHATLSGGFDAAAHGLLLRWDAVRVLIALAQLGVALWLAARTFR